MPDFTEKPASIDRKDPVLFLQHQGAWKISKDLINCMLKVYQATHHKKTTKEEIMFSNII